VDYGRGARFLSPRHPARVAAHGSRADRTSRIAWPNPQTPPPHPARVAAHGSRADQTSRIAWPNPQTPPPHPARVAARHETTGVARTESAAAARLL
jgi:hypothetical protein